MKRTAAAFMLLAGLGGGCMTTDHKADPATAGPARRPRPARARRVRGPARRTDHPGHRPRPGAGRDRPGRRPRHAQGRHRARRRDRPGDPGESPSRRRRCRPATTACPATTRAAASCRSRPWARTGPSPPSGPCPRAGWPPRSTPAPPSGSATPSGCGSPGTGPAGLSDTVLTTPARYNFPQGGIYRLKLSNIPGRGDVDLYPTLEVVPATAKTAAYLAHSSVPISFTDEDFEQVLAGNFLVKVIYLPDPAFQDLAAVGRPGRGHLDPAGAGRGPDRRGPPPGRDPGHHPPGQHRPGREGHAGAGRPEPVRRPGPPRARCRPAAAAGGPGAAGPAPKPMPTELPE